MAEGKEPWVSFRFLNIAQFIGAMNDNIFKLLLAYCFISLEGADASNRILATAGAIYVLPFIFFSSTAGILADRYSKRSIIISTRIAEIASMLFGMLAFSLQSKWLGFLTLFFLATHSAIFGPCKYGIVPEIIPKDSISKANGLLTSFSYIAIIVGTFLASFLVDITHRNYVISVSFCFACSLIALYSSWKIQKTPPAGSLKKVTPRLISEIISNFRVIRKIPSLSSAVLGASFFLFIGSYIQLNMIPYALNVLHLSDVQGGYMFLLAAFGIGVGSLLAGKFSGKAVEFGLVPLGGLGVSLCCFLLNAWSATLWKVLVLLFLLGASVGMYVVPLDSFIQVASPTTHRGRIVATSNILGFCGVLVSAFLLYFLSEIGVRPDQGFAIVGGITLITMAGISIAISGYVVRFFSFIISRFFSPTSLKGKELIPLEHPSIFFVPHAFWPWASLFLASQRRRMQFFSLAPQSQPPFFARLMRKMIPITEMDTIQDILPDGPFAELISLAIKQGSSVAIFCSKRTLSEQAKFMIEDWSKEPLTKNLVYFVLNVPETTEETGNKPPKSAYIEQILHTT